MHDLVIESYCRTHRLMFSFVEKLTDEQLRAQIVPHTHSIAFHAWHVTRWADHLQAAIPGMTPELHRRLGQGVQRWYRDHIAERWGFDNTQLGFDATGMYMPDEIAVSLRFPPKAELIDYVQPVIELAERAVRAIDAAEFQREEQPQLMTEGIWGGATVGAAIMSHVTHANRHLGMMESLFGLQGQPGSATV